MDVTRTHHKQGDPRNLLPLCAPNCIMNLLQCEITPATMNLAIETENLIQFNRVQNDLDGNHSVTTGIMNEGLLARAVVLRMLNWKGYAWRRATLKKKREFLNVDEIRDVVDTLSSDSLYILFGWTATKPTGHYVALRHGVLISDQRYKDHNKNIELLSPGCVMRMMFGCATLLMVFEVVLK